MKLSAKFYGKFNDEINKKINIENIIFRIA